MSFLLLRGEMLHCEGCNKSLSFEYEGVSRCQVGEGNVFGQMTYNKTYMPIDYKPEEDGYYFHRVCLCSKCISRNKKIYIIDDNSEFPQIAGEYETLTNEVIETINISVKEMIELTTVDRFKELVELSIKAIPSTDELNQTIESQKLIKKRWDYCKNRLVRDYVRQSAELELKINIENRYQQFLKKLDEANKKLAAFKGFFRKVDIISDRTVNPYITYEKTICRPIPQEENTDFYERSFKDANEILKEYHNRILKSSDQIQNTVESTASKLLENYHKIFTQKNMSVDILAAPLGDYHMLSEGNGQRQIIRCHECGVTNVSNDKRKSWTRLAAGSMDVLKAESTVYTKCLCQSCLLEVTDRQLHPEYQKLEVFWNELELRHKDYVSVTGDAVTEFIQIFNYIDIESINKTDAESAKTQQDFEDFIEKYSKKIKSQFAGFIRNRTSVKISRYNEKRSQILKGLSEMNTGNLGLYRFYPEDAKTESIIGYNDKFWPYADFIDAQIDGRLIFFMEDTLVQRALRRLAKREFPLEPDIEYMCGKLVDRAIQYQTLIKIE